MHMYTTEGMLQTGRSCRYWLHMMFMTLDNFTVTPKFNWKSYMYTLIVYTIRGFTLRFYDLSYISDLYFMVTVTNYVSHILAELCKWVTYPCWVSQWHKVSRNTVDMHRPCNRYKCTHVIHEHRPSKNWPIYTIPVTDMSIEFKHKQT